MFPGQGAQYVGMGQALAKAYAVARDTFAEADEALGYSLSRVIFEGPDDTLRDTEIQQPAILTVSVAVWRVFIAARREFRPQMAMGLSLGEYSAYVAAGSLQLADAVRLTRIRGRAMQAAVPKGTGGMLAVLGLSQEQVAEICDAASQEGWVEPANYNAPGQIVISGLSRGLEAARALVEKAGGRSVPLSVSAPFHSKLLEPARRPVADALARLRIEPAAFPVVANVDSALCTRPEEIIPRLIDQVAKPVRFQQGVSRALEEGVTGFLELGPGRSLTALVKKIERRSRTVSVEDPEGLQRALELV